MIRFYAPEIESERSLPKEESAHAVRVLRHHAGDEIEVVDGKGSLFRCILLDEHSSHTALEILERRELPKVWTPNLTLAVAPTKNMDRMEWLVEKAVEVGVDRIVPLLCARSERKVVKTERLRKIAVSAMKQSLKAILPKIDEMTSILDFLKDESVVSNRQLMFGYCSDEAGRSRFVDKYTPGSSLTILIGPEGDFSQKEVEAAISSGFLPVTFGDNRLRTETAALYGLQAAHILTEKL
ncbi:MAG: 16S rRNA (uracil(1498)-N(3))-methyltransferase [Muribaculaceae bacterium]|nr:16S rRNA (uracil(1498)-N(3))-methyltransferase [Muribaculaceae bacterium]